eukprot:6183346-Pleurochrysis_carterae.AAC.2
MMPRTLPVASTRSFAIANTRSFTRSKPRSSGKASAPAVNGYLRPRSWKKQTEPSFISYTIPSGSIRRPPRTSSPSRSAPDIGRPMEPKRDGAPFGRPPARS